MEGSWVPREGTPTGLLRESQTRGLHDLQIHEAEDALGLRSIWVPWNLIYSSGDITVMAWQGYPVLNQRFQMTKEGGG